MTGGHESGADLWRRDGWLRTHASISRAAQEIFAETGRVPSETALAHRAGVARHTVKRHFKSPAEALLVPESTEAMRRWARTFFAQSREGGIVEAVIAATVASAENLNAEEEAQQAVAAGSLIGSSEKRQLGLDWWLNVQRPKLMRLLNRWDGRVEDAPPTLSHIAAAEVVLLVRTLTFEFWVGSNLEGSIGEHARAVAQILCPGEF